MKEKNNNLELKIYEKLGVRKFRNILIKFFYLIIYPPFILVKMPKNERKNFFYNVPGNYFMKKGNGLQDLKDFKKYIYFNSSIHIIGFINSIFSIIGGNFITGIFWLLLNSYCVMLQRYNYIRINNTIKKFEEIENKKIDKIKEDIKENLDKSFVSMYKIKRNTIEEHNTTLDNLLDNLSLKTLKLLRNQIKTYQIYNSKHLCVTFEENNKNYNLKAKVKKKKI